MKAILLLYNFRTRSFNEIEKEGIDIKSRKNLEQVLMIEPANFDHGTNVVHNNPDHQTTEEVGMLCEDSDTIVKIGDKKFFIYIISEDRQEGISKVLVIDLN